MQHSAQRNTPQHSARSTRSRARHTPHRTSTRWFCRNAVHAERSDALNSYGTFQPMGPNLRRSCLRLLWGVWGALAREGV